MRARPMQCEKFSLARGGILQVPVRYQNAGIEIQWHYHKLGILLWVIEADRRTPFLFRTPFGTSLHERIISAILMTGYGSGIPGSPGRLPRPQATNESPADI